MSREKIIWTAIIAIIAIMFVIAGTALVSTMAELEDNRLIQNFGTTYVVSPSYYIDPRTDTCYAKFPRDITSVECSDDVKNLISNYWINKED